MTTYIAWACNTCNHTFSTNKQAWNCEKCGSSDIHAYHVSIVEDD